MRFYLDECLSDTIAEISRERFGLDTTSAHAASKDLATDAEQLAFAAGQGRVGVARNADDFVRLTEEFEAERRPHGGVIIVPPSLTGREFAVIAERLAYCHELFPEDTYPYLVMYLPLSPRP